MRGMLGDMLRKQSMSFVVRVDRDVVFSVGQLSPQFSLASRNIRFAKTFRGRPNLRIHTNIGSIDFTKAKSG